MRLRDVPIVAATLYLALAYGPLAAPARSLPAEAAGGSSCDFASGPNTTLILAVVQAGGGYNAFRATALLDALGGMRAHDELAELTRRRGAPAIRRFIVTFDDIVSDATQRSGLARGAFDAVSSPEPADGDRLLHDLLACGAGNGAASRFDAHTMLERIFSRSVYARTQHRISRGRGQHAVSDFERVLTELMRGLATT